MPAIRIYVEGGGDGKGGRSAVRAGFSRFLRESEGVMPRVIACGGRSQAYEDFLTGLRANPNDFAMLLVDAEGPVAEQGRRRHLNQSDGWDLRGVDEEQVHLMVQAVEAWLIADPEALAAYYGPGFRQNRIPATRNPEEIPKDRLKAALSSAAGEQGYHEIRDCPEMLARLDAGLIRGRCPHCRALFAVLCKKTGRPPLPERS